MWTLMFDCHWRPFALLLLLGGGPCQWTWPHVLPAKFRWNTWFRALMPVLLDIFFKGAICFLSCSRSFFGVSSVSEWFSGGSLSERQSAGLCPAVRLPPQRFNRALFRKVSPCPGKTLQCYFRVVLVTSLLWSPTPDVQCSFCNSA